MKEKDAFIPFVLDQFRRVENVTARPMFGGHGLYQGERFFGIVHAGQVFLKTDHSTRGAFEKRGMEPFRPSAKQTIRSYYEVPSDVLEQPDELARWAMRAIALCGKTPPAEARAVSKRARRASKSKTRPSHSKPKPSGLKSKRRSKS